MSKHTSHAILSPKDANLSKLAALSKSLAPCRAAVPREPAGGEEGDDAHDAAEDDEGGGGAEGHLSSKPS